MKWFQVPQVLNAASQDGSHLVVSIKVSESLHLKQVSLQREQRYLRLGQDGRRDGGQVQTVLLHTENLQTRTPGHIS